MHTSVLSGLIAVLALTLTACSPDGVTAEPVPAAPEGRTRGSASRPLR